MKQSSKLILIILLLVMIFFWGVAMGADLGNGYLQGRAWLAEDIEGKGVIDMLQTTIEFPGNGKVVGNAGCNRYFGSVHIKGRSIEFGHLGATRKMCHEAIMNQENAFLKTLESVKTWNIEQGLLYMYGESDKPILRFSEIIQ